MLENDPDRQVPQLNVLIQVSFWISHSIVQVSICLGLWLMCAQFQPWRSIKGFANLRQASACHAANEATVHRKSPQKNSSVSSRMDECLPAASPLIIGKSFESQPCQKSFTPPKKKKKVIQHHVCYCMFPSRENMSICVGVTRWKRKCKHKCNWPSSRTSYAWTQPTWRSN